MPNLFRITINTIDEHIEDVLSFKRYFEGELFLSPIVASIYKAISTNKKILIFGNGGSAADSQHFAAEFVNRFQTERRPLPALALTTDTSIITSIGNDYGFVDIFNKQIRAFGNLGDVAIGISTSGTSKNIISALKVASNLGLTTIAFTGENGINDKDDPEWQPHYTIKVPSINTARIQEIHILTIHIICDLIDKYIEEESL